MGETMRKKSRKEAEQFIFNLFCKEAFVFGFSAICFGLFCFLILSWIDLAAVDAVGKGEPY